MLAKLIQPLILEIDSLQNENKFLRQRVSDFNKKTWFSVYQENLKLSNEIKELNESFNLIDDERFRLFVENRKLMEVIKSVEAFTKQYSK